MLAFISLVFFGAVGYFAYNITQCVARILKLTTFIDSKIFGVLGLIVYVYLVYMNSDVLLEAMMKPIS
ncbi:MAG: hypothetical protein CMD49_02245 [Gammaproteobacteria bacterium]|nr:hypothetical protein [Gammaproteobacteria bacterium]|tara:strand:- start:108 stop:311 length:204 start_codon:yes stop_codon:yes gene_type:complete